MLFICTFSVLLAIPQTGCRPTRFEQLMESVRSDDVDRQRTALRELADLGPEAAPALPELLELTGHPHPDLRRLSSLAVGRIAAAPSSDVEVQRANINDILTQQLADEDLAVRNTAAFALLELDSDHAAAQRQLRRAMQQGDGGIVDRLTRTDPPPTWATPTLIEIIRRDERPSLRRLAVIALGAIDPGGRDARQALRAACHDPDDQVRTAAELALRRVAE